MNVPLLSNFAAAALLSAALGAQAFEALPAKPPVPAGNPMSKEKIELGKQLFFDPRLSAAGPVSCSSCHNVMSIATYERTLVTPNSAFDRYVKGDKKALSPEAQRGMKLVESVGCTACHNGSNFAGPTSLPVGEGFYQKFPTFTDNDYVTKYKLMDDHGRFEVTKDDVDKHMWRVPTWRNVALTAPYFHNGSVATLEEAVHVMAKTQLNKDLTNEQVADIVAFLNSLTGEFPKQALPRLPDTPNGSLVADR